MFKLSFYFLLVLCILSTQCSATAKKRSFGEVVDDNVISMKLRAKYVNKKTTPSTRINMKVWKGVVTLSGALNTQEQINAAIETAEQQAGVREVKAYLVLKDSNKKAIERHSIWPFARQDKIRRKKNKMDPNLIEEDLPQEENEPEQKDQSLAVKSQAKQEAVKQKPTKQKPAKKISNPTQTPESEPVTKKTQKNNDEFQEFDY